MMIPNYDSFRSIQHFWDDPQWLRQRMLFLSGPRQVGKTTLVTSTLCTDNTAYFNWDNPQVRRVYISDPDFIAPLTAQWICFDEIHKRPRWKDILKGLYDTYKGRFRFVVTGSARLEAFRKSGDSLVGRYFHTHLFPLNLSDFHKTDFTLPSHAADVLAAAADTTDADGMEELLHCGGFPEPFFAGDEAFWKRWSLNHLDLILREDMRDLTKVVEIDKIAHLVELLKPCAGQLVSYRNLANDLESSHGNIRRWLEMLHRLYLVFPITPYARKIRRAYKVEKKWYFMDWRVAAHNLFENYVAVSLLRAAMLYTDRYGEPFSLHFVRTHDGTEVDFLLCREGNPWLLIEVKEGLPEISSAVHRFSSELHVPCAVVTRKSHIAKKNSGREKTPIYSLSWAKVGRLLP
ncbi:MAG: ATP-binding protein [Deltaproteobacteria bacterium]|nr:ATP-binding protein [Deltaproteobacteria bacterium]